MLRPICSRVVLWSAAACVAIILSDAGRSATAQQGDPRPKKAAAKKAKKPRGRLPSYYRQVVDEKQRETIYKIQAEYAPKIAALKAELNALIKQRNDEVAGVLTPEQLKKVEELKAAKKKPRRKSPAKTPTTRPAAHKPAKAETE